MAKKQTSTRNIAFNGYEIEYDNQFFYASLNSSTPEGIKKITNKYYSNIKLLNSLNYVKLKGKDIVNYTKTNKEALYESATFGYNNIIQNTAFNTENKDFYVFGAPFKMVLDNEQAYGDCGIDSVLNILVSAGIMTIKDENTTEKTFLKKFWDMGIADDNGKLGVLDKEDGATSAYDLQEILKLYDIYSSIYGSYSDIEMLGNSVENGDGVILAVSSGRLWFGESQSKKLDHFITVIGAVYDISNPTSLSSPTAFIIHDTGGQMTRFITPEDLKYAALYDETQANNDSLTNKVSAGFSVLITSRIKADTDNVNATGDKNANIIYGNAGNNIIKGLDGNDILYGETGSDTIYGGNGNDTIYADEGSVIITGTGSIHYYGTDYNKIYGENGNDVIFGSDDNDTIYGGAGNDFIQGNGGKDIIYGGAGNDTIYGVEDRTVIYGDSGNDIIFGGINKDRIFGGAGNDIIDGGNGDDVVIAGDGNDTIIANMGNDKVEVGNGNDVIIFESHNNGSDTICNSGGSITFQYEYNVNAQGVAPIIGYDANVNTYNLYMMEETGDNSVVLKEFFNYKNNKSQTVYMDCIVDNDGGRRKYIYSATKSANARVANIGEDIKNKDINNILFTTNKTGTTVTTSKKNDTVFMYNCPDIEYSEEEYLRKDKITYTGGKDAYFSFVGNTNYIVDFNKETNLNIADNITPVYKVKVDEFGNPYIYELEPSKNDSVKLSTGIDNVEFFFDVDNQGKVTQNADLIIFYKNNENINNLQDNMIDIAKSNREASGFVDIYGFFKEGKTFGSDDFYGNGLIEEIYTNENGKNELYHGLEAKINSIKSSVMNWLEANNSYSSAFEAFSADEVPENIASLVACYT